MNARTLALIGLGLAGGAAVGYPLVARLRAELDEDEAWQHLQACAPDGKVTGAMRYEVERRWVLAKERNIRLPLPPTTRAGVIESVTRDVRAGVFGT